MARSRVELQPKNLDESRADRILAEALRGREGRLTRSDAVVASGLPVPVVEGSLQRLLQRYRSHLAVTEQGELLYSFDPHFRLRGQPTLGERLFALGRAATRLVVRVGKALIAVVLVVYVVIFVTLLIGAMVAARSAGRDRDGGWGGGDHDWGDGGRHPHHGIGFPGIWWFFLPGWSSPRTVYVDSWGRAYHPPPAERRLPRKRFIWAVFDFVFGPAEPPRDPLEDEREVLAWIRAHGGRLVASDLVALFGWSLERAEEEVTRLMIEYDGEPEVTENAVIVYRFPELQKTGRAGQDLPRAFRFAWERLESAPPLTGNSAGMNALIIVFALFNVVAASVAPALAKVHLGLEGPAVTVGLGVFPLVFFSLFLLVPLVRAVARAVANRGRARRNRERLMLRKVFRARGEPLPPEPELEPLLRKLEGDVVVDDQGRIRYAFPRIGAELRERDRLLALADQSAERQVGAIVFDTDDDPGARPRT